MHLIFEIVFVVCIQNRTRGRKNLIRSLREDLEDKKIASEEDSNLPNQALIKLIKLNSLDHLEEV